MAKRALLEGIKLPDMVQLPDSVLKGMQDPLGGFNKVLEGFLGDRQNAAAARQEAAIEQATMIGDTNALRALTQAGTSNQAGLWDADKLGKVQKAASTALGTHIVGGVTQDIDTAAREGKYDSFDAILERLNDNYVPPAERARLKGLATTGRETAAVGEIGRYAARAVEERDLAHLDRAQELLNQRQGVINPATEETLRTLISTQRPDVIGSSTVRAGEQAFKKQLADTTTYNKKILESISKDPIGSQYVTVDSSTGSIIPIESDNPEFRQKQADYLSQAGLKQYDMSGESLKVREELLAAGLPLEKVETFTGAMDKYKQLSTSLSGAGTQRQTNAHAATDADKNSKISALDARYRITELINNSTIKKMLDEKSFSSGALMEYANKLIPEDSGLINSTIFTGKKGNVDVKEVLTGYLDNTGNKFTRAPSPLELKEALDAAKATRVWDTTPVVAMDAFDKFLRSKIAATDSERKTLESEKPKIFEEVDNYYKARQNIEATATREKMLATAGIYRDEGKPDIGFTNGLITSFTNALKRAGVSETTSTETTADTTVPTETAPPTADKPERLSFDLPKDVKKDKQDKPITAPGVIPSTDPKVRLEQIDKRLKEIGTPRVWMHSDYKKEIKALETEKAKLSKENTPAVNKEQEINTSITNLKAQLAKAKEGNNTKLQKSLERRLEEFQRKLDIEKKKLTSSVSSDSTNIKQKISKATDLTDDSVFKPIFDALVEVESKGNPKAISPSGAMGTAQVLLSTALNPTGGYTIFNAADKVGVKYDKKVASLPDNNPAKVKLVEELLFNNDVNVNFGQQYLKAHIEYYKKKFPKETNAQIIARALRRYNGYGSPGADPNYVEKVLKALDSGTNPIEPTKGR